MICFGWPYYYLNWRKMLSLGILFNSFQLKEIKKQASRSAPPKKTMWKERQNFWWNIFLAKYRCKRAFKVLNVINVVRTVFKKNLQLFQELKLKKLCLVLSEIHISSSCSIWIYSKTAKILTSINFNFW